MPGRLPALHTHHLSWLPIASPSNVTLVLNAADTWLSLGFHTRGAKTLEGFRAYVDQVSGTPQYQQITATLYATALGVPTTALSAAIPATGGAASVATGWLDWTGFNYALNDGQQYSVVLKNTNGTPGSNNVRFRYGAPDSIPAEYGNSLHCGFTKTHTTTGGGSYTSTSKLVSGYVARFADGTYSGAPLYNHGFATTLDRAYGTRESGVRLTWPDFRAELQALALPVLRGSVTTAGFFFKVYVGKSLKAVTAVADSNSIANGTSAIARLNLERVVVVEPGSDLRVTVAMDTNSSTGTPYYAVPRYDWDSTLLALRPFGGTMHHCAFDGSAWNDYPDAVSALGLSYDPLSRLTTRWPSRRRLGN